jgi:hypothetical protein
MSLKVSAKPAAQFEPFWITIDPNWYTICQDFGLADVEKWKELQKKWAGAPANGYSVFRNGINFTMLSPTLFYLVGIFDFVHNGSELGGSSAKPHWGSYWLKTHTRRTDRHHVGIQHHERRPPIPF